jgi:hypothetical protein
MHLVTVAPTRVSRQRTNRQMSVAGYMTAPLRVSILRESLASQMLPKRSKEMEITGPHTDWLTPQLEGYGLPFPQLPFRTKRFQSLWDP